MQGNTLTVWVKANAHKTQIQGWDKNREALRVDVSEPAQDNKANTEIVKFFTKLSGRRVRILRGLTGKKKTLVFD